MTRPQVSHAGHHGDRPLEEPTAAQRRQVLFLGLSVVVASIVTALAAFSDPPSDAWLYRLVRDWTALEPLSVLEPLTAAPVLVGLLAVTLLVGRCRTFVLVATGCFAGAWAIGWLLALVVGRERPLEAPVHTTDSYPATGLLLLTVVAGLLPLALESFTRRSEVRHVAGVLLGALVAGAGLWEVASGARWPLDAVGAVVIGAAFVSGARVLLEEPDRHPWCGDCLWQRQAAAALEVGPVLVEVDARRARALHRVTLFWVAGLVAAYALVALTGGLPRTASSGVIGTGLEVPLQWTALALVLVGVGLARRWHLAGTVLVAVAAAVLGYASSVQYPPWVALVITVTVWVPAGLLWLEWHRRATVRAALAASVAGALVLGGVVGAAANTYALFWGPTHPSSTVSAPVTDVVEWMWVGGVTSTSAEVRLRTAEPSESVRVVVSEDVELAAPLEVPAALDDDRVAAAALSGLRPGTRYYYAAEVDGVVETARRQSFTTFPEGPASFSFALGSCQIGGSDGQVFDAIRAQDPLFVLSMGDWNYGNIDVDDPDRFRDQYDLNLTAPAQAALFAQAPVAYVWGDHDYGGNDADRTSASRPAAMRVYRQMTPHYPLAGPESPLYQAFTVGRVRFLLTDTRASRDPASDPSGEYRSTLGTEQRAWLLGELAQADRYGLVVWVNPDPWVSTAGPGKDTWGGFAEERQVLADAVAEQGVDNLLMVSGDAHMLAFDDGTNTDYSASQAGGFPLFHAAAIDRPGSVKGGPYTGAVLPGGGQFGTVEVRDDGSVVEVTLTGWNWRSEALFEEELRFPPP